MVFRLHAGGSKTLPGERLLALIVLTANALLKDRERILQAGMSDYLNKSLLRETLAAALLRVVVPGTAFST